MNIRYIQGYQADPGREGSHQHIGDRKTQEDYAIIGSLPGFNKLSREQKKEIFEDAYKDAQAIHGQEELCGSTAVVLTASITRLTDSKQGGQDSKASPSTLVVSSASVGDSRGIVIIIDKDNQVKQCQRINQLDLWGSTEEENGVPFYNREEHKAGSMVVRTNKKPYRLQKIGDWPDLALKKSIGDQYFSPYITAVPNIREDQFSLEEGDRVFILAASDALTDGFEQKTSEEDDVLGIATIIANGIAAQKSLDVIIQDLRGEAVRRLPNGRPPDNFTAVLSEIGVAQSPIVLGVFDGHGGQRVAQGLQKDMWRYMVMAILKKRLANLEKLADQAYKEKKDSDMEKYVAAAALGVVSRIREEVAAPNVSEETLLEMAKAVDLVMDALEHPQHRTKVVGDIEEFTRQSFCEKVSSVLLLFAGVLILGTAIATCALSHGASAPLSFKLFPFAHSLIGQGIEGIVGIGCLIAGWHLRGEKQADVKTALRFFSGTLSSSYITVPFPPAFFLEYCNSFKEGDPRKDMGKHVEPITITEAMIEGLEAKEQYGHIMGDLPRLVWQYQGQKIRLSGETLKGYIDDIQNKMPELKLSEEEAKTILSISTTIQGKYTQGGSINVGSLLLGTGVTDPLLLQAGNPLGRFAISRNSDSSLSITTTWEPAKHHRLDAEDSGALEREQNPLQYRETYTLRKKGASWELILLPENNLRVHPEVWEYMLNQVKDQLHKENKCLTNENLFSYVPLLIDKGFAKAFQIKLSANPGLISLDQCRLLDSLISKCHGVHGKQPDYICSIRDEISKIIKSAESKQTLTTGRSP